MAGRLGAAPSKLSFGDSVARAGARPVEMSNVAADVRRLISSAKLGTREESRNLVTSAVTKKLKGPGALPPGPRHFNKEQTPLGDLLDPNPRFHGGCFGVFRHTSPEALKL